MRSLFWLLAVFAAAVALVLLGRIDAGYAMLVYPPWRVEMSPRPANNSPAALEKSPCRVDNSTATLEK